MGNKILILGKGFIGERIQKALSCDVSEKLMYSYDDAESEVLRYQPKVMINCIGSTGAKNVDGCELDKNTTLLTNTFIPIFLGEVALRHSIKLVHISSGCIFHYDYIKNTPVTEDDAPDFLDLFYSRSKMYTDRALECLLPQANILILRIRIPLDNRPHPKNILTKLLNFKKVIDIDNSVTYLPDFVKMVSHLLSIDAQGIYNAVNKGGLRYSQLLDTYKKYKPEFTYSTMSTSELKTPRTNVVLSTEKLEKTGFVVRPITEVLDECVKSYLQ